MEAYQSGPAPVNPTLAQALRIAALGWRIFPLHPIVEGRCGCVEVLERPCDAKPGKHPMIGAWQHNATTDVGWIHTWWGGYPNRGIGIATGPQSGLLVVDVDRQTPEIDALVRTFNGGPKVRTARGTHYYFRYPHDGYRYANRASLITEGLDIRGDGGYVVAPGSLHAFGQRYVELVPIDAPLGDAPEEFLARIRQNPQKAASASIPGAFEGSGVFQAVRGVPHGQHDAALHKVASALRGWYGLDERTIRAVLPGLLPMLDGYDPSRPYTDVDFDRLARSAGSYAPTNSALALQWLPDSGDLIFEHGPQIADHIPVTWLVPSLLPAATFTLAYGPPASGKSTLFGSIMDALAVAGQTFVHVGVEESSRKVKARLAAHDPALVEKLYGLKNAYALKFPRCLEQLFRFAQEVHASAIVVDTLHSHFEGVDVYKAPEVRPVLEAIHTACVQTGIALVGGSHTNKEGRLQASTAFEEVPRAVLRVQRQGTKVRVATHKVNDEPMPDLAQEFAFCSVRYGEMTLGVLGWIGTAETSAEEMASEYTAQHTGKQSLGKEMNRAQEIADLLQTNPLLSSNEIHRMVGGDRNAVMVAIKRQRSLMSPLI